MTALTDADREALNVAVDRALTVYDAGNGWYDHTLDAVVEQIIARHLEAAASAIDTRRHTYVQSGGLPELIPSNHAAAERLGHLDGLAAAAEIVRALAAPQAPSPDLRP